VASASRQDLRGALIYGSAISAGWLTDFDDIGKIFQCGRPAILIEILNGYRPTVGCNNNFSLILGNFLSNLRCR
jgi:hypothetical protein